MSRLFISLFLDEDVSVLIAKLIRSRAYSAMTTLESRRVGRSDVEQLEFATSQQMAILTHNAGSNVNSKGECPMNVREVAAQF